MRPWTILIAVAILGTGCTHTALERRTVKQASTLTDLQYKQVMDNLAMFAGNNDALAWHVKLKGGVVQIADQGSGGFTADITTVMGGDTRLMPAAAAQRGVLNQWDVEPAVDSDELEHLGLVYRKAVNPADPALWNQMHDAIAGLSARFSLIPQIETTRRIVWKHDNGSYPLKGQLPYPDRVTDYPGAKRVVQLINALENEKNNKKGLAGTILGLGGDVKSQAFRNHQIAVLEDLLIEETDDPMKQGERRKTLDAWRCGVGEKQALTKARSLPKTRESQRKDARPLDETSDTMPLILSAIHAASPVGYLPTTDVIWDTERNPGLIDQAEDKIRKFEDLLTVERFQVQWLGVGCKNDVPKCACYVGYYRNCGRDCYVWVTPDNQRYLREYTLAVLTMAPIQAQDVLGGRGAAFSPTLR